LVADTFIDLSVSLTRGAVQLYIDFLRHYLAPFVSKYPFIEALDSSLKLYDEMILLVDDLKHSFNSNNINPKTLANANSQ
jgi:hypothetical protein